MANGDKNIPIEFSFWTKDEEGTDSLYGECETTVTEIENGKRTFDLSIKGQRAG